MTADDLAALHAACFTVPRPWSTAEFESLLLSPQVVLITAPHGFALGRVIAGEAELLTIAVHPDARRQGTGRLLLSDLIGMAAARGAETLFLEVRADNDSAIALYRSAGLGEVGRRKAYYFDGTDRIDALVMRLEIGAKTAWPADSAE